MDRAASTDAAGRGRALRRIGPGLALLIPAAAVLLAAARPQELFVARDGGHAVEYRGVSRGVAWGDFDADGDPDLFVSHPTYEGPAQRNVLYRNDGGRLVPVDSDVSAAPPAGWEGATWIDVDGDGDVDLHTVGRNGAGSRFFENRAGVLEHRRPDPFEGTIHSASMTCWADGDGDGRVDAFVVGSGEDTNHLFRNLGGWRMEAVPLSPLAGGGGASRACAWLHPGGDRRPVLAVANARTPNLLLRSDGDLRLVADTTAPLWTDQAYSYGMSAADVNGDGFQDLFVANFDGANALYLGTAEGDLEPVELGSSLQSPASKGHVWADFDNDARLDLYLGSGTPREGMFNRLWRGSAGGFVLDTTGAWAEHADTSAAVAGADVDSDGDIDLFVANWGSDGSLDRLYVNQQVGGHWVQVDLRGRAPNTGAVGARVSVRTRRDGRAVWLHRWVTLSTGYSGQNQSRLHFGLGDASEVDSMVVSWPAGGSSHRGPTPADRVVRFEERGR